MFDGFRQCCFHAREVCSEALVGPSLKGFLSGGAWTRKISCPLPLDNMCFSTRIVGSAMDTPPLCFWIVDDDMQFGKSLRRMLKSRGISAEYFGSARSFLDSVPPGQPGFAIVDINMPDCNGFDLIQKMRDLHYDMPVILITGNVQSALRDMAMQCGAIGYLQKPFSEESLLELARKYEHGADESCAET
ncbi:MAG: response regulator [Rubrivivax sp.]|nr:response regulator [Rubrivivax sp.]